MIEELEKLQLSLDGELLTDYSSRIFYATDASMYFEMPLAVCYPKGTSDIKKLIAFALDQKITLIPRAAGTSLAGQVVGSGIVVDVTKHLNKIIELNVPEKFVVVEPGVVLDELNIFLKPHNLFFAPETSSSSRCTIGGMVGNNSCGSHSLIYGSTRDHLISISGILSDGSEVEFKLIDAKEFQEKTKLQNFEGAIYRNINEILTDENNKQQIKNEYPDYSLKRRNTGYAIDLLMQMQPFNKEGELFNFCKLIAGSEGTLVFIEKIKLNLIRKVDMSKALVCVHLDSVIDATKANLIALNYKPVAVELIDKIILDCTKENISQRKNRFFLQGDPGAILIVEFEELTKETIISKCAEMETEMRARNLGYHFPVLYDNDANKIWSLRNAGLGLLSNVAGGKKPVPFIEDTAVNVNVLPDYIEDYQKILNKYNLQSVYYAHIGTGELHLRPILDLSDECGLKLLKQVANEVAVLVKKYKGSLSGEHGDGRLRGEFISFMIGEHNYQLLKKIKTCWDKHGIFNQGKIVDTPQMISSLRLQQKKIKHELKTVFDFSSNGGMLGALEQCGGNADCRKSNRMGGAMCPTYKATLNEKLSTRARTNLLKSFLYNYENNDTPKLEEVYEVLSLCLSCKACKAECPSNIDMTKLKSEFLQFYYDHKRINLRTKLIAGITKYNRIGSLFPSIYTKLIRNTYTSTLLKKSIGFANQRSIPSLHKQTLKQWAQSFLKNHATFTQKIKVLFFADEFTNYYDVPIGIKAIQLLSALGYPIEIAPLKESGRTYLSKGMLRKSKKIVEKNTAILFSLLSENCVLVGIEPSTILTFRDEYIDLTFGTNKDNAQYVAQHSLMIDEFIESEINQKHISKNLFTKEKLNIKLHGHCHQKVLSSTNATKQMLSFPENYYVEEIQTGCCGMAGSFGFEKEHYELSNQIGEMLLFPEVRNSKDNFVIAAPGTSCRQHIKNGTGIDTMHPIEIFYLALLK